MRIFYFSKLLLMLIYHNKQTNLNWMDSTGACQRHIALFDIMACRRTQIQNCFSFQALCGAAPYSIHTYVHSLSTLEMLQVSMVCTCLHPLSWYQNIEITWWHVLRYFTRIHIRQNGHRCPPVNNIFDSSGVFHTTVCQRQYLWRICLNVLFME